MGRTAMLVFFGQQLVEEIMDAQRPGCPREFINIPVPKGHPYNPDNLDNLQMPFLRTRYNQRTGHSPNNPRQQLQWRSSQNMGGIHGGLGREAYGLKRLTWDELEALAVNESAQFKADLKDSIENLKKLDGLSDSPDSLDVFPGGLLETTTSGPGPLFQKITIDQFLRIRTWGPLLVEHPGLIGLG
nr:hypothetical protein BaRGS_006126 [Batillaria attramentaria]